MGRLIKKGVVEWGRYSYGEPTVLTFAHDSTRLLVGPFVSIGRGATFILGGNHQVRGVSTFPFRIRLGLDGAGSDGYPWSKGDIIVGPDAWIGAHALVLSGVEIGAGAVVAAGAIVVHDVPPYAIVAGSPARVVGFRLETAQIEALLRIRWWEWNLPKILSEVVDPIDDSVNEFVSRHDVPPTSSDIRGSDE